MVASNTGPWGNGQKRNVNSSERSLFNRRHDHLTYIRIIDRKRPTNFYQLFRARIAIAYGRGRRPVKFDLYDRNARFRIFVIKV